MSDDSTELQQLCFVDMPYGIKIDPKTGVEIDFDAIYREAIEPAANETGLRCLRGDQEKTGGIIHRAMFARLLLSDFVIADMTTASPNVFYELGVRHTAKPYTTIPIYATIGLPPFDVNMVRAIPYELEEGKLGESAAAKLRDDIQERIRWALEGEVQKDSPLFQLFPNFPGVEISHELTDVFKGRIQVTESFQTELDAALASASDEEAVRCLGEIKDELGDLKAVSPAVLMKLFLTYRDASAWQEMVSLYDEMPVALQEMVMAQQQLALALNRRGEPGDRDRSIRVLQAVLETWGESAETCGILGRVFKDQYKDAREAVDPRAEAYLDEAINAYTRGFECEPVDYYPGVNAINLLIQKGTPDALEEADRLTPLVTFAVARRGGAESSDYWDLATVLELAVIGRDETLSAQVLPKVLMRAEAGWMAQTTADNLRLVLRQREGKEDTESLERATAALDGVVARLTGGESEP